MTKPPPPKSGSFYFELSEMARSELIRNSVAHWVEPGQRILLEGDTKADVVVILGGYAVAKGLTPRDQEVLLRLLGPGDLAGAEAAIAGLPQYMTVEARMPMHVMVLTQRHFRSFVDTVPGAAAAVSRAALRRSYQCDQRIRQVGSGRSEDKLASLLLELAESYGVPRFDGSTTIVVPLTQEELAGWVGLSRESAARAFRTWRAEKLVTTSRRKFVVLDKLQLMMRIDQ